MAFYDELITPSEQDALIHGKSLPETDTELAFVIYVRVKQFIAERGLSKNSEFKTKELPTILDIVHMHCCILEIEMKIINDYNFYVNHPLTGRIMHNLKMSRKISQKQIDSAFLTLKEVFTPSKEITLKLEKSRKFKRPTTIEDFSIKNQKAFLDSIVHGNEDYKRNSILFTIKHCAKESTCDDRFPSNSFLVHGSSGCGKTYTITKLLEHLELKHTIIDCSTLTAKGWHGDDLDEVIVAAWKNRGNPTRLVVVLDEFDKICLGGNVDGQRREHLQSSQTTFLKVLENSVSDKIRNCVLSFIFLGSFSSVYKKQEELEKFKKAPIGFTSSSTPPQPFKLSLDDLNTIGLIPELAGRIGMVCSVDDIDRDGLNTILHMKQGPLQRHEAFWTKAGLELNLTEEEKQNIVDKALKDKTGARSLSKHLDNLLNDRLYNALLNREEQRDHENRSNQEGKQKGSGDPTLSSR